MLRIVVTICAVSQLATALPQRQLAQPQSGPRPVSSPQQTQAQPAASTLGAFNQALNQQLAFGVNAQQGAANPHLRGRVQSPYSQAINQPIIISQAGQTASPATPAFASFGGANPFGGAGRQILTLRSPNQQADEDEYEYEDDDEPAIHSRPSPRPSIPSRTPVRASPTPASNLGANRFSIQQQPQQQQQRQRQPIASGLGQFGGQQLIQPLRAAPRPDGSNQFGIDGKRSRLTTPPPVQTLNRYMKQNEDGSTTWGYENEDGTFKEETLGVDCVVRGKYGYVDPEGNKREYEYQTGNPCDPNKKDQEEEEEEELTDGPSRPQQLAGVLNARPRPVQRRPGQQQQQQIPQQYQQQPHPQYALS